MHYCKLISFDNRRKYNKIAEINEIIKRNFFISKEGSCNSLTIFIAKYQTLFFFSEWIKYPYKIIVLSIGLKTLP
jgi:hypothetical protein